MRIEEIGEFGLIELEAASLKCRDSKVRVGIGDDAAVIETGADRLLVATTDMLVEGVHFRLDWTDPRRLGWKSIAVNLSDIAAMGAQPGSAMISLAFPHDTDLSFVNELYAGMESACERYGTSIVGGDTVASANGVIINVAVLGNVEEDCLALRSGASPGDTIIVTGTLGDSAAGLALLQAGYHISGAEENVKWLLDRHLAPTPRIPEARAAVATGAVRAMMDISDGLAGDIRHIAKASGVGVLIREDALPTSDACRQAAKLLDADPLLWALSGGEDYELLIVAAPDKASQVVEAIQNATGERATIVGEMREGGLFISGASGERELSAAGYHHF